MSGHSKWSTIKRKKGANDTKRGKLFTRLGREITIAARSGADVEANFALRIAVERARQANMPKDNIDRAIKRGSGDDKDAAAFEEVLYEAYGPHGIALLIQVATDNRNRTLAEIKHALNRHGGNMAQPGSVSWQFVQKGYIAVPPGQKSYDDLFLIVAEAGADDVIEDPDTVEIYTPREQLQKVEEALRASGVQIDEAKLEWVAKTPVDLEPAAAVKVMATVDSLEELDDMQAVASNLNITDDLVSTLATAEG
jgi:YebC/PmpR family DNA-binding regulatory protein